MDRIAVASTALAMRALQRAVKMVSNLQNRIHKTAQNRSQLRKMNTQLNKDES